MFGATDSFVRESQTRKFLEITFSDAGPGIPNTLSFKYEADTDYIKDLSNKESDIVKYAFELNTSSKGSKSLDVRDGSLDFPRGLFFVKNIVRNNEGCIICSSGCGQVLWDFSARSSPRITLEDDLGRNGRIPGTTIRILIPLRPPSQKNTLTNEQHFLEAAKTDSCKIHNIAIRSEIEQYAPAEEQFLKLTGKLSKLASERQTCIILDFLGVDGLTKDIVLPLLVSCGAHSLGGAVFCVINSNYIENLLTNLDFLNPSDYATHQRPLLSLSVDESGPCFKLIGMPSTESPSPAFLSNKTIKGDISSLDNWETVLEHIIDFDNSGRLTVKFPFSDIIQNYSKTRLQILKKIIFDPKFEILHEGKFILPSGVYAEDFVELNQVFSSKEWSDSLSVELLSILRKCISKKPTTIISLSRVGQKLSQLIRPDIANKGVKYITISDAYNFDSIQATQVDVERNVVILVDVLLSGKSITNVCESMILGNYIDNISVIAAVDRRPYSMDRLRIKELEIDILSILQNPAVLHAEIPASWRKEDVVRIDHQEWKPIYVSKKESEFKTTEEFLAISSESDSLFEGHFEATNGHHYKYFFATSRIVESHLNEIVNEFYEDIILQITKAKVERSFYIMYPERSKGVKEVALNLAIKLGTERVYPIHDPKSLPLQSKSSGEKIDTVVILDSACSTNRTIMNLFRKALALNPGFIYGGIIMSRTATVEWDFIKNIEVFGRSHVSVRTFSRIQLPVYHGEPECVICKRIKVFKSINETTSCRPINQAIKRGIDYLEPKHIRTVLKKDASSNGEKEIFLWRHLIETVIEGAESGEIFRDVIKAQDDYHFYFFIRAFRLEAFQLIRKSLLFPKEIKSGLSLRLKKLVADKRSTHEIRLCAIEMLLSIDHELLRHPLFQISEMLFDNTENLSDIILELLLFRHELPESKDFIHNIVAQLQNNAELSAKKAHSAARSMLVEVVHWLDVSQRRDSEYSKKNQYLSRMIKELRYEDNRMHSRVCEEMFEAISISNCEQLEGLFSGENENILCFLANDLFVDLKMLRSSLPVGSEPELLYLFDTNETNLRSDLLALNNYYSDLYEQYKELDDQHKVEQALMRAVDDGNILDIRKRLAVWLVDDPCLLLKKIDKLSCDIKKTVLDTHLSMASELKSKNIILNFKFNHASTRAFIDKETMKSILENILHNALRHPFAGRHKGPRNAMISTSEKEEVIEINYTDNGLGASSENCKKLLSRLESKLCLFDGEGCD